MAGLFGGVAQGLTLFLKDLAHVADTAGALGLGVAGAENFRRPGGP